MSRDSERWRREEPVRDRPIRDYASFGRHSFGTQDPVSQGVKLGYSVLEEQMREGQRLAERLRPGASASAAAPEVGVLIERALNIYRDMGALALSAVEALSRGSGARPEAPAQSAAFTLDMRSARRATVTLNLPGSAKSPRIGPLQGALSGVQIEGVSYIPGAPPVLKLDIPDDRPAGLYHAIVVEAETGVAVGTLTVNISA